MLPESGKTISSGRSEGNSREKTRAPKTVRNEFSLSLTVRGSSVPMHAQQRKDGHATTRHKSSNRRKITEPRLPVDKIVFLAERLALTENKNKNQEFVTSSMEIIREQILERRESEPELKEMVASNRKVGRKRCCSPAGAEGFSSELGQTMREKKDEILAGDFDFSLDISSLSYGSDESSTESEGCDCEDGHLQTVTGNDTEFCSEKSSGRACGCRPCGSCFPFSKFGGLDRRGCPSISTESEDDSRSSHPGPESSPDGSGRRHSDDLVSFYVNSVGNRNDLIKYFRSYNNFEENGGARDSCGGSEKNGESVGDSGRGRVFARVSHPDKLSSFEGDRFGTEQLPFFSCEGRPDDLPAASYCDGCRVPPILIPATDCLSPNSAEKSTNGCEYCISSEPERFGDFVAFGKSREASVYATGLAKAAQSARILARDLESLLSNFEYEEGSSKD